MILYFMVQNDFTNYNIKVKTLEDEINQLLNDFKSISQNILSQHAQVSSELNSTIEIAENTYNINLESLKRKLELLKAEVYRYRFIFEDGTTKFGKMTPEIDSRIKQLEESMDEHINLKILTLTKEFQDNKNNISNRFDGLLQEIKVKIDIIEDEYLSKLNNHINNFVNKIDKEVSLSKGTADINSLFEFVQCNFSNSSQFLNIGILEKTIVLNGKEIKYSYPDIIKFIDSTNLVILYDQNTQNQSENITDSTIFRMISSHLPDKLKLHIYDFKGMGTKFSEFLSLPKDILINGWNEDAFSEDISLLERNVQEYLSLIWKNIDTNTQSVHEYNINRIKNDEYDQVISYHLYVIDNFQEVLNNQHFGKYLNQVTKLTNYGSNFILMLNSDNIDAEKVDSFIKSIQSNYFHLVDLTGNYQKSAYSSKQFLTINLSNQQKKQIVESFYVELSHTKDNRNKLQYIDHVKFDESNWFSNKASGELKLPIGRVKNGDEKEYLYFKTKDVLAHALLCGGVGSGKTNFLKTIITSISILYSPKEVEMYLIDLKNGAGFSVFQQCRLPHAKLFAFSAENELINDVFNKLIIEMETRYTEYAKYNIDNLDDVYKNIDLSANAPKRIVVIIDEFASVFSGEGSFQDEIANNVNILAAKGRAMGINLLLSTQDFSVIRNSIFDKAIAQMATRIVLKSSPEGAMKILGSSNQGYRDITNIGEGFINTNFGELNSEGGNRYFKSFLLETNDLLSLLGEVYKKVQNENYTLNEPLFIDSAKEAIFDSNQLMFNWLSSGNAELISKNGINCWIGESYLLNNNEHCSFNWKINGKSYNQNILISGSGNDRELTLKTSYSIISSLTYTIPDGAFGIVYLNSFDDEQSEDLGIPILQQKMSKYSFELMKESQIEELLNKLSQLIEARKLSNARTPQFVFIVGLEKLIKLHKTDYEPTIPGRQFIDLLSTGNNYGIYFVCEISKPNNIEKIHREIINHFEHRISYYMNPDDSDFMMNSKAASQLEKPSNQNVAAQAIYYSQSEQYSYKFKPYKNLLESNYFTRKNDDNLSEKFILTDIHPIQIDVVNDNKVNDNKETNQDNNPWAKFNLDEIGDDWNINLNN